MFYIFVMQLELFPLESLSEGERESLYRTIRNCYWHLRSLRGGRWGQAKARRYYRIVAEQKKRLLMAGVSKREILDLLACCRLKCSRHRQPFKPCQFCP